jgi:hypothetical protein
MKLQTNLSGIEIIVHIEIFHKNLFYYSEVMWKSKGNKIEKRKDKKITMRVPT